MDFIENFTNISFFGRLTYAMSCLECVIIKLNLLELDEPAIKLILNKAWKFTDCKYLDEWHYEFSEVMYNHICEFKNYNESDMEYIVEEEFYTLYGFYKNIEKNFNLKILVDFMEIIFVLSRTHIYSKFIYPGQESLDELIKIINFMNENKINIPCIENYKQFMSNANNDITNNFWLKDFSIINK